MYLGSVTRVRHMPLSIRQLVGEMCRQLQAGGRARISDDLDIPEFPGFGRIGKASVSGVCQATVGAHKLHGAVEVVIAIYDEGDDTAPVLILVEEEIDQFIRQAA